MGVLYKRTSLTEGNQLQIRKAHGLFSELRTQVAEVVTARCEDPCAPGPWFVVNSETPRTEFRVNVAYEPDCSIVLGFHPS